MSRHRRPSYLLARAYSTLINPRPLPLRNQKTTLLCIGSNDNWTSERMATTRSFLSHSKFASTQYQQCSIRQQQYASPLVLSTLSRRSEFFDPISIRCSSNTVNTNNTNDGTTTTTTDDDDTNQQRGKECYKLAIQALQNASLAKQKHEARMLQEQYDAMDSQRKRTEQRENQKRHREKQMDPRLQKLYNTTETNDGQKGDAITATKKKDRAAGVAVVRTIVKQSQPKNNRVRVERTSHGNGQSNNNNNNTSQSNDKSKQIDHDEHHWQQVAKEHMEEAAFRHGHCLALVRLGNEALERAKEKDDSSALIDREGCRGWIDESPVDLATILDLSANIESESDQQSKDEDSQSQSPYLRLALHLYEEGGNRGSAEGWYNLGHLLWDMQDGGRTSSSGTIAHDSNYSTTKEKAMDAFHNAMEMGDADAMYFVASQYLSYEEGGGEEVDDDDALHLLLSNTFNRYGPAFLSSLPTKYSESPSTPERPAVSSIANNNNNNQYQKHGYEVLRLAALDHNHGPALHHLSLLHLQSNNTEEFRHLLSKSAATGHPDSLFLRGHCHHFGTDGHAQDLRAAFDDFSAAADGDGHVDAMVSAGAMLHRGVVSDDGIVIVERDRQRAFDLYQRAGELGSVEGWRNVVSCYATGEGVPKCLETARYIANTMLKE